MTDRELELIAKVALVATIVALVPLWRKFGLRKQSEFDTAKPRRGLALVGIAVVLLALGLMF